MASDMKYWDVFRDPLWLVENLLRRYRVVYVPLNANWHGVNITGSGYVYWDAAYHDVRTGTTANSSCGQTCDAYGLNGGDVGILSVDFSKKLIWMFGISRRYSDPEVVAWLQLKTSTAVGDLAGTGIGVRVDNYAVTGEAYGSARGTLSLGTLTDNRVMWVKIVHIPGNRVEFWVNNVLIGSLTGTAVPTGAPTCYILHQIKNGSTGGVNASFGVGNMWFIQEW
jgi:hypothetical protein